MIPKNSRNFSRNNRQIQVIETNTWVKWAQRGGGHVPFGTPRHLWFNCTAGKWRSRYVVKTHVSSFYRQKYINGFRSCVQSDAGFPSAFFDCLSELKHEVPRDVSCWSLPFWSLPFEVPFLKVDSSAIDRSLVVGHLTPVGIKTPPKQLIAHGRPASQGCGFLFPPNHWSSRCRSFFWLLSWERARLHLDCEGVASSIGLWHGCRPRSHRWAIWFDDFPS